MLQNIPAAVGRALQALRGGPDKLVSADPAFDNVPEVIGLSSPAFGQGEPIPVAHTDDGDRVSPPLEWIGVPPEAQSLVLLIEDQDSPTPRPLVHAILPNLEARDGRLAAGALPSPSHSGQELDMGRNSFLSRSYLPPDPPRGHGVHRYAFQIFALDEEPQFDRVPGRSALVEKLKGHVIARGLLVGTYERR